ncbi:MAG: HIT family protein [Erysipelotrichaceae bacterium]|nr:HIT family protein [Erysipelotrichaceae bacterium]
MYMCIFCKIINGEIPSKKIYEDEDIVAILDISQATKGHTLVLPKKHFANILEIEDYEYLKVMDRVKDLASVITKTFNASGVNILNNCGETAGQTVMHFHVHIIPRYENTDVKIEFTSHEYNLDEIQKEILKSLKQN